MRIPIYNILFAATLLGAAWADDKADKNAKNENDAKPAAATSAGQAQAASNRKAYDELYSEILNTLPQNGKAKVDSARHHDEKPAAKPATAAASKEPAKEALEKQKRELEELPPVVKARVDKVLSDLETRRKEKELEFRELKP
jgi:hypothetical protein